MMRVAVVGVVAVLAAGLVAGAEPYQEGYAVRSCQEYRDVGRNEHLLAIFPWWQHIESSFSAWNLLGDGETARIGSEDGWYAWVRDVNRFCKENPGKTFGDATLSAYLLRLEAVTAARPAAEQPPGKEWKAQLVPGADVRF